MWGKGMNKESKHGVAINKPLTGKKINLSPLLLVFLYQLCFIESDKIEASDEFGQFQKLEKAREYMPGEDASGSLTTADIIEAIDYARLMGAEVINNASFAGSSFNQSTDDAITKANTAGILFVAAAGNGGSDGIGDNNDSTPLKPPLKREVCQVSITGWFIIIWNGKPHYSIADDKGQTTELLLDEDMTKALGGPLALDRKRVIVFGEVVSDRLNIVRVISIKFEKD